MPGLFGIVRRAPDPSVHGRITGALSVMQRAGSLSTESVDDPAHEWVLGRAHRGVLQPVAQGRAGASIVAWLHGDLTNAEELRAHEGLDPGVSSATLLARLYERHGPTFASRLDGAFAAAVFDVTRGLLVLVADRVGSYPIYWRADAVECAYSSDLTALIGAMEPRPALDLRAVADYLTIGFVMGDRTLAAGIRLLGPGEVLLFDRKAGAARVVRYSELADLFQGEHPTRADYVESVTEAFNAAVRRSAAGPHRLALSLSGGLDSRAILSALGVRSEGLTTYTLGIKGCADEAIAADLATMAKTEHRFFELSERYLRDFLPNLAQMVSLTDGLYLSHGFTEMLAFQFLGELDSEVLLRGHGGELAKMTLAWPLHTDEATYRLPDLPAFAEYMASRANYLTPGLPIGDLLDPSLAPAAGSGSADSLREELAGLPLNPAQACGYLYLRGHHRRSTVPSLELFRMRTEIRLPFLDVGFLRALLSAPPSWRDGTDIHRAIVTRGRPGLARVRNSNTGAAVDAGPLTERVLDKVNTVLKRANVAGYRHYHNFDGWMRRMLLESVERELLAPAAYIHGWVRPHAIERLLAETRSGAGNHAYLLQGLLILELWQRENSVRSLAS
jgi:asparagine synthase (glutamine-hydrolysing)